MTRPCGATRPPLLDAGWECYGTGLVIILTAVYNEEAVPVVLPRRALEIIDPEPWWDHPLQPFTGGDHLHLCVPRHPRKGQDR